MRIERKIARELAQSMGISPTKIRDVVIKESGRVVTYQVEMSNGQLVDGVHCNE